MMKRVWLAGMSLCACTFISAQVKAVETTKNFKDFTGISLNCDGDVYLKQGNEDSFVIKCDEKLLSKLNIYLKNNTVYIKKENCSWSFFSSWCGSNKFDVYVTMKKVNNLSTNASGDIKVEGDIRSENLSLRSSSSGDLKMNNIIANSVNIHNSSSGDIEIGKITAKTNVKIDSSSSGEVDIDSVQALSLNANVTSSGEVEISGGSVDNMVVNVSSSGEYDSQEMKAKKGNLNTSSSGDITVMITEEVSGSASSGGEIRVYGNPKVNNLSSSSGGSVKIR